MGRCGTCELEWSGTQAAHCKTLGKTGCCETFGSDTAFYRHRTKDYKCIPVSKFSELQKDGQPLLVMGGRGYWVTALQTDGTLSSATRSKTPPTTSLVDESVGILEKA